MLGARRMRVNRVAQRLRCVEASNKMKRRRHMSSKSNGRGAGRFAAMFALGAMLNALIAGNAFAQAKGKDSLQARLRQVEDRQAIEQRLMGDYPRALDAFNWKAYAALFTHRLPILFQCSPNWFP